MKKVILSSLMFCVAIFASAFANAQFVEEKSISENEAQIPEQLMALKVLDASTMQTTEATVNIYGLNPRKPIEFTAIRDTTFEIRNYRLYTVSCVKEGYMYYSEKFWPDEKKIHIQDIALRPLALGLKTDVRDITFLGDKTEIYHKSKPALEELVEFLKLNPTVRMAVIGHVNGPDNAKSQRFYTKASLSRAEAVIDYLVSRGIDASRLEARGAGNTSMLYPDPVTDWQNEANRRIEIEVIGL